jgi:hypothetical protein
LKIYKLSEESCTIPSTSESGVCITLVNCPNLVEEYRKDRTNPPVICNKESRKICCPLRFVEIPKQTIIENKIFISTEAPEEPDIDESENFTSSQIVKSLFMKVN